MANTPPLRGDLIAEQLSPLTARPLKAASASQRKASAGKPAQYLSVRESHRLGPLKEEEVRPRQLLLLRKGILHASFVSLYGSFSLKLASARPSANLWLARAAKRTSFSRPRPLVRRSAGFHSPCTLVTWISSFSTFSCIQRSPTLTCRSFPFPLLPTTPIAAVLSTCTRPLRSSPPVCRQLSQPDEFSTHLNCSHQLRLC